MVDFQKDDECFCDDCKAEQELKDYLVGRLRVHTFEQFSKEFLKLTDKLTNVAAPLAFMVRRKMEGGMSLEEIDAVSDYTANSLIEIGHMLETLQEHAGYFAVDKQNLLNQDGADQCSDWDK